MPENMESAKIMIVDDVPENLKLLDGMLQKQGYKVLSFPSGRLALQAAEKNPPDLILLDINMPEMNGYDVCERLKADGKLKEVPVIFISALNDTMDKIKAFTVGGVDYVTKPFQFEEVQARVHTHLELAKARRALEELLSRTLTGSLRMLSEILATVDPDTFKLAGRLQRHMKSLVREIGLKSDWSFELAALFSNMCLIATSPELRNKYSTGTPLNASEQKKSIKILSLFPNSSIISPRWRAWQR
jgi:DNA-binding response OmpR family regulator